MKSKVKKHSKVKKDNLQERVIAFMKDETALFEKYGIVRRIVVSFPQAKTIPLFGRIAVKFLKWSGGIIDAEFADKQK